MNYDEFKDNFLRCVKDLDLKINLNDEIVNNFYKYMLNIIDWNSKINVTAIENHEEFLVKHFIDSLTINQYINDCGRLLDIGTGAGFPGIPIKFVNENLQVTLLDSVNKKLNVIRDSVKDMNLKNIEIIHSRAEDLARDEKYRESFDYVTTRAVSQLTTILEYMIPFLKVGGIAICMKGPNYEEEIKGSKNTLDLLGAEIIEIKNVIINNDVERNIIVVKKNKKTNKNYPRSAGKPVKEPLN